MPDAGLAMCDVRTSLNVMLAHGRGEAPGQARSPRPHRHPGVRGATRARPNNILFRQANDGIPYHPTVLHVVAPGVPRAQGGLFLMREVPLCGVPAWTERVGRSLAWVG